MNKINSHEKYILVSALLTAVILLMIDIFFSGVFKFFLTKICKNTHSNLYFVIIIACVLLIIYLVSVFIAIWRYILWLKNKKL